MRTGLFVCIAAAASFSSCLSPTEIVIQLSTDVACSDQTGVAVAIGPPGNDGNAVSASSTDCSSDGGLGTIVVIPSGAGEEVGIRVVLGVDASVENCDLAHDFAGCIVARRALSFDPHFPLLLPIELERACVGNPCDAGSTCSNGTCVDPGVACDAGSCDLLDAGPPPPPPTCTPWSVQIAQGAAIVTPHIARVPTGYLVTYVSGSTVSGVFVSPDGTPAMPRTVAAAFPDGGKLGPVGSDGSQIFTFIDYQNTGQTLAIIADTSMTATATFNVGVGPLEGVLADDAGAIAFFGLGSSTSPIVNQIYRLTAAPSVSVMQFGITTPAGADAGLGFGLSRSAGTLYASFASALPANTCNVLACTTSPYLQCSQFWSRGTCDAVRFAASADGTAWVAAIHDDGTQNYAWDLGSAMGQVTETSVGAPLDDPEAFIPLATGATFQLLYRSSDVIYVKTSPTSLATATALTMASSYHLKNAIGAGFDAVADDPASSPGYAIVYWTWNVNNNSPPTGNIELAHFCSP